MSLTRRFLLVPLALPVSAALSPARLEGEASALGARLGAAVSALHAACVALPPVAALPPVEPEAAPRNAQPLSSEHGGKHGARPAKRGGKKPGPAGGIFVGSETVLRIARSGIVPSGRPIGAQAGHPGGIVLMGVSGLGVGVSDGDILTEVEGRAVQTEGQVVGLVLGARSRHAPQVSAVVWRAGTPWSLVVEMPYLPAN